MAHKITFRPGAENDLDKLYTYIRDENGGPDRAIGYIRRIREMCLKLCDFPARGTQREDLAPGVRTIGFERRVTIAFRVQPDTVEILAVAYGGRQLASEDMDR